MNRVSRVAVIGTGGWAQEHARAFSSRTDIDLVAILGRSEGSAEQRAATYGARGYADLEKMLRTGLPLLVEKPLVFDLVEADELLAISEKSGSFFAINFNHRYGEAVVRAKEAIETGVIGEPVFATWRFGGEASASVSPDGNVIETQCHGFDLLEHLAGPIVSLSAHMTDKTSGTRSTIAVALEFASRAVGTMLGTYDSSYAYQDTQIVEIGGTAGRLVIHDTVRSLTISRHGDEVESRWQAGYFDDEARSFRSTLDRHVEAILVALRAGQGPPVPAQLGRRALQLAMAAIDSHQSGRRIDVSP